MVVWTGSGTLVAGRGGSRVVAEGGSVGASVVAMGTSLGIRDVGAGGATCVDSTGPGRIVVACSVGSGPRVGVGVMVAAAEGDCMVRRRPVLVVCLSER